MQCHFLIWTTCFTCTNMGRRACRGWVGVWFIAKLEENFCIGKKTEKKSKCTTQVSKKESQRDLELLFSHGTFFCTIAKEIKTAK